MKIGVFGGSFDPPHIGHLFVAEQVKEKYLLEKVVFLPLNISDDKPPPIASAVDRLIMVNLAIYNNPIFELSNIDIKRGGYTYTYQSLIELNMKYPNDELYFITGYDAVKKIKTWQNSQTIFQLAKVIGCSRGEVISQQSESQIDLYHIPLFDISSTECRRRLCNNITVRYMITDPVISYIKYSRLYQKQ